MSDQYIDLHENLNDGNVSAFVGAGLSIGAGLPGWYGLIGELAGRIKIKLPEPEWVTGETLIDAAQDYVNRQGPNSLIEFLKKRLDTTGIEPTVAHQALVKLPISLIFTANYDDLLERACREAGKRVHVMVSDQSIAFMRRNKDLVNIVKLYGDLNLPDTIVLTREQYESFFL
ncbi:MAG: SIR2 family protein, partial [Anaerolineales bacterium]